MKASEILEALDIPLSARLDRRVPKKLLLENGAPTAADRRHINDGIEELWWIAALKPTTVAVPEYRDETREYLEVAILRLVLRAGARTSRIVELVHRAVPYPVLLLTEAERTNLSSAHKRWSQGETGKTVLDGSVVAVEWDDSANSAALTAAGAALALGRQPQTSLHALYQGWMDVLHALQAARLTGVFAAPGSAEDATARREALQECVRLDEEIARLRAAAAKECQLPRQVELNLELKRVEAARASAKAKLT